MVKGRRGSEADGLALQSQSGHDSAGVSSDAAKVVEKRLRKAAKPMKRGKSVHLRPIKDKKLKHVLAHNEKLVKEAQLSAAQTTLMLPEEAGFLQPEQELEATWRLKQRDLAQMVDVQTASKIFSLSLPTLGPYNAVYSRNGRQLLLAGRKGHVASVQWQAKRLRHELQLEETVRDAVFLQDEHHYAVAQKKYVFLYDNDGVELHCLRNHIEPMRLDYLPYHWLLLSVGKAGFLKYQDVSTGKIVAEHRTRLGACDVLRHNPANAIAHLGHVGGTVTLWNPNMSAALVKMLVHRGPVTGLAVDQSGRYMATAGADSLLKLWDLRTYKCLYQYTSAKPVTTCDFSQRGVLGTGYGAHVTVWKDAHVSKQASPYMHTLLAGHAIRSVRFVPFEDVLGVGHSGGFDSLVVPGTGEANFDAFESNPYQTSKQLREDTVHKLLDKVQPETITMHNVVGRVDRAPAEVIEEERRKAHEAQLAAERGKLREKQEKRKKMRGRNSAKKRWLKRQENVVTEKKSQILEQLRKEKEQRERQRLGLSEPEPETGALSRFA